MIFHQFLNIFRLLNMFISRQVFVLLFIASAFDQSYSQSDDIKIITTGNSLICDTFTCPPNAARCSVTKKSINNDQQIERVRICFDATGKEVGQSTANDQNPTPGKPYIGYAEGSRNGTTAFSQNPEEVKSMMAKARQTIQENMEKLKQTVQNGMSQAGQQIQTVMEQARNQMNKLG